MRRFHFLTGVLAGLLLAVAVQTAITYWHGWAPVGALVTAPPIARPAAISRPPIVIDLDGPLPSTAERSAPPTSTPHWFNGQKYYIVPLSYTSHGAK